MFGGSANQIFDTLLQTKDRQEHETHTAVDSSPSLLYANLSERHKARRLSFSENVHSESSDLKI